MKDIVLIESITVDDKAIVVTAIVEDIHYVQGSMTMYDPPEYAPGRCKVSVPFEDLPDDIIVSGLNEDQLQEVLNRYVNLDFYDWDIVDPGDYNDQPRDDDEMQSTRVFF